MGLFGEIAYQNDIFPINLIGNFVETGAARLIVPAPIGVDVQVKLRCVQSIDGEIVEFQNYVDPWGDETDNSGVDSMGMNIDSWEVANDTLNVTFSQSDSAAGFTVQIYKVSDVDFENPYNLLEVAMREDLTAFLVRDESQIIKDYGFFEERNIEIERVNDVKFDYLRYSIRGSMAMFDFNKKVEPTIVSSMCFDSENNTHELNANVENKEIVFYASEVLGEGLYYSGYQIVFEVNGNEYTVNGIFENTEIPEFFTGSALIDEQGFVIHDKDGMFEVDPDRTHQIEIEGENVHGIQFRLMCLTPERERIDFVFRRCRAYKVGGEEYDEMTEVVDFDGWKKVSTPTTFSSAGLYEYAEIEISDDLGNVQFFKINVI